MPVVIFFSCLDLEQKSSFMDGHYLKQESGMKINRSLYNSSPRAKFWNYFLKLS